MNRMQFAMTVAEAYMNQYHHQEWRRKPVMGTPVIDYDTETETFAHCSSLTPPNSTEIRVFELSDGMFGNDYNPTGRDIVAYLMDDDGIWQEIVATVEGEDCIGRR